MTEYAVHGSEGEGHPTGGAQESTAVHAQVARLALRIRDDLLFQQALPPSLGDGHVLLIGDNLGGHWQVAIEPRVKIRFTDPSIVDLGFRAGRNSLWVGHIHHRHNCEFFYRPKITAPRLGLQLPCPICTGWLLRQLNSGSGRKNCERQGGSNPVYQRGDKVRNQHAARQRLSPLSAKGSASKWIF